MKKAIRIAAASLLIALVAAPSFAAFVAPTPAQIAAAVQDPSKVEALLTDATDEEVAEVIKKITAGIMALEIGIPQKRALLGRLFWYLNRKLGRERAEAIIALVVVDIPAGLIPSIADGAPFNINRPPESLGNYKATVGPRILTRSNWRRGPYKGASPFSLAGSPASPPPGSTGS